MSTSCSYRPTASVLECSSSSAGERFHLSAVEATSGLLRLVALSEPHANNYWFNLSAAQSLLPGHSFDLTLHVRRECHWQRVPLLNARIVTSGSASHPQAQLPLCAAAPTPTTSAFIRLQPQGETSLSSQTFSCGRWCNGDVQKRILDTSNDKRYLTRRKLGFSHTLISSACIPRLYDETMLTRCLNGRHILLMGSSSNVDLQRGFALLNASLASWTRTKPGKVHPNVADFWRAYEKPSGSYCYARGKCAIAFGASSVNSYNFHYPEGSNNKGGLLNLRAEHYRRMCDADILVFESSYDDLRGSGGASSEWKERLGKYESRLKDLMVEWRKCKEAKKEWRGIFALGTFARGPPGASASSSSSSAKQQESTAEMKACGARGASSSSPDAHQMAEANDVARRIVTGAGYEVFEGAASATLHARSRWFEKDERAGGVVRPSRKVEPLADLEVQLLVGQICA